MPLYKEMQLSEHILCHTIYYDTHVAFDMTKNFQN